MWVAFASTIVVGQDNWAREAKDRAEIEALMSHYARALDTVDGAAYAATYTVDGQFGTGANATKGREALKKMVDGTREQQAAAKAKGEPARPPMYHMEADTWIEFIDKGYPLPRILPDGVWRRRAERAGAHRCRRAQRQPPRTRERQVADQTARRGAAGLTRGSA